MDRLSLQFPEITLQIAKCRENTREDGFASDCILSQAVHAGRVDIKRSPRSTDATDPRPARQQRQPPCCYVPLLFSVRCLSLARHRHRSQRAPKHSEHEKSYTRAPMRARSMAPRIESGAAATQNVKPFTSEG